MFPVLGWNATIRDMSGTARRLRYTYSQYVALEEESSIRHEYLEGEIYAMAGGSPDHAALAATLIGLLRPGLPRGCRAFTSDLRVRIAATGLSTYPDVAVVCGRTERATDDPLAVANPVCLVEITSPSTEDYDRVEKLRHYQHLPSVRHVLIVSHREPWLTVHTREASGWTTVEARRTQVVRLSAIATEIAVDEVYRDELEDANYLNSVGPSMEVNCRCPRLWYEWGGARPYGFDGMGRAPAVVRSPRCPCCPRTSRAGRPASSASPAAGSTCACPSRTADAGRPSAFPTRPRRG